MKNSFKNFQSYEPCLGKKKRKIKAADGSFSPIAGKGLIKIYVKICLNFVLYFPKLAYGLLFVSKLSKESNYPFIFYYSHCV